jgi:hypothetical protein
VTNINVHVRLELSNIYSIFIKIEDDKLYAFEYTGGYKLDESSLRTYDLKTGKMDRPIKLSLPDRFNGYIPVSVLQCFTHLD